MPLENELSDLMKKIKVQKTRLGKAKNEEEEETDFYDIILEIMRSGLFPKMP